MFGIAGKDLVAEFRNGTVQKKLKKRFQSLSGDCVFYEDRSRDFRIPLSVYITGDRQNAVMVRGEIYNLEKLGCSHSSCLAESLWHLYEKQGDVLFNTLNGAFVLAVWNGHTHQLRIVRDKIGMLQCFYSSEVHGLVFANDPAKVQQQVSLSATLYPPALIQYLLYCYNPGVSTLFSGVHRLRPAHYLSWEEGKPAIKKYWEIRFDFDHSRSAEAWGEAIRTALEKAVRIRISPDETGAFLSGGLDSSSVVSLLNKQGVQPLSTFSFRCRGESFDESHYARIVADTYKTQHERVEYGADDILKTESMVACMDEPFSDVGINVATYLLSQAAGSQTRLLFTGDGGDELFAGHPVYMADKMGAVFRHIPEFLRRPVFAFGRSLPDSEQKKDWKVKLKRFSESYQFPESLGTQRWRIYYGVEALSDLLHPDLANSIHPEDIFKPMILYNQEANGPDALSRSLHADYQTVVQFYLRRLEITRHAGLSPRCPMLDPEIVELCARIPSRYKIRGWDDTKYIEKVAVEPLLPHEIVYRKDKLGHSIPLKNWMRDHEKARSFILDLISAPTLKRRGLFNPAVVKTMWEEQQARVRNHSHRIWALAVLELWMRAKGIQ